jgi:hypothetical protein
MINALNDACKSRRLGLSPQAEGQTSVPRRVSCRSARRADLASVGYVEMNVAPVGGLLEE